MKRMLLPPIFASCYALVTRLRYEDREAVADRDLLAVARRSRSVLKSYEQREVEKIVLRLSFTLLECCSHSSYRRYRSGTATRSRTNAIRVCARSLLEQVRFAKL